jgi:hypothetical protein
MMKFWFILHMLPEKRPRLKLPRKHPLTVTHGTLTSPMIVRRASCPQYLIHFTGFIPTNCERRLKE